MVNVTEPVALTWFTSATSQSAVGLYLRVLLIKPNHLLGFQLSQSGGQDVNRFRLGL